MLHDFVHVIRAEKLKKNVRIYSGSRILRSLIIDVAIMVRSSIIRFFFSILILITPIYAIFSQSVSNLPYKSQEISDKDDVPVLIKHLPNWEDVRSRTIYTHDTAALKGALGAHPVLDLIDFTAGTEAVAAPYDAGKLLIVEYSTPQVSVEDDGKFTAKLAEENQGASTLYRRIGNYNVFVFDVSNEASANALLDQVHYEKSVTWLGKDPYLLQQAERAFVISTSNLFLSTVAAIAIGIGLSVLGGIMAGFLFFRIRERKRAGMATFSDAGGMTRLNLDGLRRKSFPIGYLIVSSDKITCSQKNHYAIIMIAVLFVLR